MVLSVIGVGAGVAPAQSDGVTEIDSCTTITESGTYELTEDIENSAKNHCITIKASQVEFQGNGHLVDGVGDDTTVGVYVPAARPGILVENLEVTDWDEGIRGEYDPDGSSRSTLEVRNVTSHHNKDGVKMLDVGTAEVLDSEIYNNSDDGIHITGADSPKISDTKIHENGEDGIYLYNVEDGGVDGNVIKNNSDDGIDGHDVHVDMRFVSNTIVGNGDDGLYFRHISQDDVIEVTRNEIRNNHDEGIHLTNVSGRMRVIENTICNNDDLAISMADTPEGDVIRQDNDLAC